MITCTVCGTANHHLGAVCSSCGGFLQNRPENIDLFTTSWRIFERPGNTLHAIALSRHKNMSLLIGILTGPALVSFIYWFIRAGNHVSSFVNLLIVAVVIGLPFGLVTHLFLALVLTLWMKATRAVVSFRNAYAILAYAQLPMVFISLVVFPLELVSFGQYFFSSNPSPYMLKPVVYVTLLSLNGVLVGWTLLLIATGVRVLGDYGVRRSAAATAVVTGLYVLAVTALLLWGFPSLRFGS